MSGVNGDKARFNRERKKKIARRLRNQKMQEGLAQPRKPVTKLSAAKSTPAAS